MGVIQSSLNQALVTTAALASQSPAFEKRKQEKLRQMDIKKTEQEALRASKGASEALKGVIGSNVSPAAKEVAAQTAQQSAAQYSMLYQKDPSNINLKRYQNAVMGSQIAKGVQSGKLMIKPYSAQQLLQDRAAANQRAIQKASEQSKQMNEIKQHTKYSDEDDLQNPYYYLGR